MGLSAGSLDKLIIESRRGGMRSFTLSSLRASLKLWILDFNSRMAAWNTEDASILQHSITNTLHSWGSEMHTVLVRENVVANRHTVKEPC